MKQLMTETRDSFLIWLGFKMPKALVEQIVDGASWMPTLFSSVWHPSKRTTGAFAYICTPHTLFMHLLAFLMQNRPHSWPSRSKNSCRQRSISTQFDHQLMIVSCFAFDQLPKGGHGGDPKESRGEKRGQKNKFHLCQVS